MQDQQATAQVISLEQRRPVAGERLPENPGTKINEPVTLRGGSKLLQAGNQGSTGCL